MKQNEDNGQQDERSPLAIGYAWSVHITSLAIEMVVYVLLGLALDHYLHTLPLFIIIGAIWAMWVLMHRLVTLDKQGKTKDD